MSAACWRARSDKLRSQRSYDREHVTAPHQDLLVSLQMDDAIASIHADDVGHLHTQKGNFEV